MIKLVRRQLASETVVYDLKICLRDLRCLFDPHIRQFAPLESNGFQFLSLLFIVHAPEDDLIPVRSKSKRQWTLFDIPVSIHLVTKYPISCARQFRIGTVPVRDIRFPDTDQVPALILHQAQEIILGRINTLPGTGRSFHHDIPLLTPVHFTEARIGFYRDVHPVSSSP